MSGHRFGLGLDTAGDGSARGDVYVTLTTAALVAPSTRITVSGTPSSATLGVGGQATLSGVSTVTVGSGAAQSGVPFTIALGRSAAGKPTFALTLGTTQLPATEVSEGQVTIR